MAITPLVINIFPWNLHHCTQHRQSYLAGHILLWLLIFSASAPPVNVVATQSGSSAPVEVTWSSPSDEANIITSTGYRIFYGSGKNASVSAVATYVGQNISVRSEGDQLYSELINTSITIGE